MDTRPSNKKKTCLIGVRYLGDSDGLISFCETHKRRACACSLLLDNKRRYTKEFRKFFR